MHHLKERSVQNSSKQVCWWIFMLEDNRDWIFHWRRSYYELCNCILARSNGLALNILMDFVSYEYTFSLHKTLIDGLDLWIIVMFFFFISCLGSYSDGTHSLQRIHWWASDVMQNFLNSAISQKYITYFRKKKCKKSVNMIFYFQ